MYLVLIATAFRTQSLGSIRAERSRTADRRCEIFLDPSMHIGASFVSHRTDSLTGGART